MTTNSRFAVGLLAIFSLFALWFSRGTAKIHSQDFVSPVGQGGDRIQGGGQVVVGIRDLASLIDGGVQLIDIDRVRGRIGLEPELVLTSRSAIGIAIEADAARIEHRRHSVRPQVHAEGVGALRSAAQPAIGN